MQSASKDPTAHRKQEEAQRERFESMAPEELEKLRQEDQAQRKKQLAAKMKIDNEV